MADPQRSDRVPSLFSDTARGMLWDYGATLAQFAVQLAVLAVLARLLTPEDFGLMGIALVVVAFANLATQAGIGQALIQRPSIDTPTVRVAFTLSTGLGVAVAVAVYLAAGPLAALFLEPDARPVIQLLSISFVALGLGSTAEALLQRDLRFRDYGVVTFASYVVGYGLVAVTLAVAGAGVWALAIAAVAQALLKAVLALAIRPHHLRPSLSPAHARRLIGFGGGVTVSKVLNTVATQGDYLLVGRALGATALGLYNRAYQLMLIPVNLVGQAISKVLFSSLSKVQREPAKLREAYLTTTALVGVLGTIGAALLVVVAPEIVAVVLGPQWERTVTPFRALSVVLTLRIGYKLDDALAKASGAIRARIVRDAVYAGAVLAGVAFGVRWGVTGAAIAVGAAIALNYVLGVGMSLAITRTPLAAFVSAHRSGAALGTLTLAAAVASRWAATRLHLPDLIVLVVVCAVVLALLITTVLAMPAVLSARIRRFGDALLALAPDRAVVRRLRSRIAPAERGAPSASEQRGPT